MLQLAEEEDEVNARIAAGGGAKGAKAAKKGPVHIKEEALLALLEMQFSRNACIKALIATAGSSPSSPLSESIDRAVNWMMEHLEDADIESPVDEDAFIVDTAPSAPAAAAAAAFAASPVPDAASKYMEVEPTPVVAAAGGATGGHAASGSGSHHGDTEEEATRKMTAAVSFEHVLIVDSVGCCIKDGVWKLVMCLAPLCLVFVAV